MSDFFLIDGVALPQLRTTWPGDRVEMPNVSSGQTDVSQNSGEHPYRLPEPAVRVERTSRRLTS